MNESDSEFWRFSLALYAKPGVPEACLTLQDNHGVDVNLLFFLIYLASEGYRVSGAEVRQVDAFVKDWRERVVWPLRSVRRSLKLGVNPVTVDTSDLLRTAIKREELRAEQLQQHALEAAFARSFEKSAEPYGVTARHNIGNYGLITGDLPATLTDILISP